MLSLRRLGSKLGLRDHRAAGSTEHVLRVYVDGIEFSSLVLPPGGGARI
jgi:hypothetical protein